MIRKINGIGVYIMMRKSFPAAISFLAMLISGHAVATENIIRTAAPIAMGKLNESWASAAPIYSDWLSSNISCSAWSPDPATVNQGEIFTQSRTCDKSETRTVQDREVSSPSGYFRDVGVAYSETNVTPSGSTESQDSTGTSLKLNGKYMFGTAFSGTSNAEGYSVSDNYHADTRGGWLAFDNDLKSLWYPASSYGTAYIQVSSLNPVVLRSLMTHYDFSGTSLNTGYLATSISIKASNDGVNFTPIATKGLSYSSNNGAYNSGVISIQNSIAYKFYRFSIAPTSHPYVALQTLVLSSETNFEM